VLPHKAVELEEDIVSMLSAIERWENVHMNFDRPLPLCYSKQGMPLLQHQWPPWFQLGPSLGLSPTPQESQDLGVHIIEVSLQLVPEATTY
jgi:hypothetical protein